MKKQQSIFITGAGRGLGREIATLFAQAGWRIGATDIGKEDLTKLQAELGEGHYFQVMDVTKEDQVASALAAFAKGSNDCIDVLINNAGLADINHFEDIPLARHKLVTEVNVIGVLNCAYLALPYLRKSEAGALINMCSQSAVYGTPSEVNYSASKFWVRGFSEGLNIEWERHGVYVCSIMPNFVATPMMAAVSGQIVDNLGINLTPADVARVAWQAVSKRGKVHWVVDTRKHFLLTEALKRLPPAAQRIMMKRACGY